MGPSEMSTAAAIAGIKSQWLVPIGNWTKWWARLPPGASSAAGGERVVGLTASSNQRRAVSSVSLPLEQMDGKTGVVQPCGIAVGLYKPLGQRITREPNIGKEPAALKGVAMKRLDKIPMRASLNKLCIENVKLLADG